jgi:hypothetical protein
MNLEVDFENEVAICSLCSGLLMMLSKVMLYSNCDLMKARKICLLWLTDQSVAYGETLRASKILFAL